MSRINIKKLKQLLKGKSVSYIMKHVCGELIGHGAHRSVYELKINPNYVIKIERDMSKGNFANATEWRNYIDYMYTWDFMAPCILINETGNILIQQRTTPKRRKDYPKYIPNVFTDLKLSNFGWIGDKFVCHDYSFLLIGVKNKMKYAKWWGTLKKKQ